MTVARSLPKPIQLVADELPSGSGTMKTCENCGEPVYNLGCTWCNELDYIEEQAYFDELNERDRQKERESPPLGERE